VKNGALRHGSTVSKFDWWCNHWAVCRSKVIVWWKL